MALAVVSGFLDICVSDTLSTYHVSANKGQICLRDLFLPPSDRQQNYCQESG